MISFERDHICLVTGASSGIGFATALLLNSLGATVVANGRSEEKLQTLHTFATEPEALHLEQRDLAVGLDELPDWVTQLRKKYGKLSGFVHCAGHSLTSPIRNYDTSLGESLLAIHYHAPMLLARGFADRRNNSGNNASMVFVSALGALSRPAGLAAYAAVKGALISLTGVLCRELAPQGIRVNAVAPGLVQSPMGDDFLNSLPEELKAREIASYPLGLGTAEDVANIIVFLLSKQARWLTGQNIVVDGGHG